jgi:hypothetical protein
VAGRVHAQVELFTDSLADQPLIAEDEYFFNRLSAASFHSHRTDHIHRFSPAISVLWDALAPGSQLEMVDDVYW